MTYTELQSILKNLHNQGYELQVPLTAPKQQLQAEYERLASLIVELPTIESLTPSMQRSLVDTLFYQPKTALDNAISNFIFQETEPSDSEKLMLLKNDLYRRVRSGQDIAPTVDAINCLVKAQEADRKHYFSLPVLCLETWRTLVASILLTVLLSYGVEVSGLCRTNNSQVCQGMRTIPFLVRTYFQD